MRLFLISILLGFVAASFFFEFSLPVSLPTMRVVAVIVAAALIAYGIVDGVLKKMEAGRSHGKRGG